MRQLCLIAAAFLLAAACEGKEIPPLSEAARSEFGKVVVLTRDHHKPFQTARIERFAPGMAGGGRESTISTAGFAAVLPELLVAEIIVEVASSSITPWSSARVKDSPALKVEKRIATPITTTYPLNSLNLRIVELARPATDQQVVADPEPLALSGAGSPDYRELATAGLGTILDVDVLAWGLTGKDEDDPPLLFFTQAHAKVISVSTGKAVYNKAFTYFGHTHRLDEWIANEEELLRADVQGSVPQIAKRIVEDIFLLWRPE